MEEAEILADKIAIISSGKLLCFGTSMELKKAHATGYVLKLLTTKDFKMNKLMEMVQKHIPNATSKVCLILK